MPCASRIRGSAPVSGTYYFGENAGLAVRPRFLGPPESKLEDTASPIRHVRSGMPPFLVTWAEQEFPHLKRQAHEMVAALQAENIDVQTLELPDCNHFTASYVAGEADGLWPTTFDQWSARILGNKT